MWKVPVWCSVDLHCLDSLMEFVYRPGCDVMFWFSGPGFESDRPTGLKMARCQHELFPWCTLSFILAHDPKLKHRRVIFRLVELRCWSFSGQAEGWEQRETKESTSLISVWIITILMAVTHLGCKRSLSAMDFDGICCNADWTMWVRHGQRLLSGLARGLRS